MSDVVIYKFRKSMIIHDTECSYWDQVSLNNTNLTKPNQTQLYFAEYNPQLYHEVSCKNEWILEASAFMNH